MGETMPKDHRMINNFLQAKKSVEKLGLNCMKIDYYPKGCMWYYNENSHKSITNFFICGMDQYKTVTRRGIKKKIVVKKCSTFLLFQDLKFILFNGHCTSHEMT